MVAAGDAIAQEHGASLATLVREHGVIAGYDTAPKLHRYFEMHHGIRLANQVRDSVAWESLVTVFRRAYATNTARALQLLRIPLPQPGIEGVESFPGLENQDAAQARVRELKVVCDKAKQRLEHLNAPGGHQAEIDFYRVIAEQSEQDFEKEMAEWRASLAVGGTLGVVDENGNPAEPNRVTTARYRANEATARLAEAQKPETHAENVTKAIAKLADSERELRAMQVDPAKILHARLYQALDKPVPIRIDDPAWLGGVVVLITSADPIIADFAAQNEGMITKRIAQLQAEVTADSPPEWVSHLPSRPNRNADLDLDDAWLSMALAVAIYRDLWNVEPESPLGPELDENTNQGHQQQQLRDYLADWNKWAENFIAAQNLSGLNQQKAVAAQVAMRIEGADESVRLAVGYFVAQQFPDALSATKFNELALTAGRESALLEPSLTVTTAGNESINSI